MTKSMFKSTSAKLRGLLVMGASALMLQVSAHAATLTGAGATFPYPIYAKWASEYKKTSQTELNYQSIGSGGGIKQIQAKTVDFGASDMPLNPETLKAQGLFQFPAIIGGVVPVVNVPGITAGQLKLSGPLLADIYLGKVKKWNDAKITALNQGLALPEKDIVVVARSDGSGTTFLFTNYLSKVSADWKKTVSEGTAVKWPNSIGGKGNEGVANYVKTLPYSIGYVEYAYARQNKLAYIQLQNRAQKFVAPDDTSFQAAAAKADWSKSADFDLVLTDQLGDASWPITGASFIIMHKAQAKPETGREVIKFFSWAFKNGSKMAIDLEYVPLPKNLVDIIHNTWKMQLKDTSGKALL